MYQNNQILIGKTPQGKEEFLNLSMANRHGIVAGATGTGKTTSVKVLVEGFSDAGVPVLISDVKGDPSSLANPSTPSEKTRKRIKALQLNVEDFTNHACPVRFWDVLGKTGIPVRAEISDMGPLLLAEILDLNPTQKGVLQIVFKAADDLGWEMIDFKDLKAMLSYASEHRKELSEKYGNIAPATLSALQRSLLSLEEEQAEQFFGQPQLNFSDWMVRDHNGKGVINILQSRDLSSSPALYSAFLIWMLSSLYDELPEAGDLDKPKFVMVFDEAHLLFENADKALIVKLRQVIKLIRSRGVGIYFISQSLQDIDEEVLGQLQNRIQHGLHAYTPKDRTALRSAADSFRSNPDFDTAETISNLGIGQAVVSFLDENGVPSISEKVDILPCQSSFEAIDPARIEAIIEQDPLYDQYREAVDEISAYERFEEARKQQADQEEQKKASTGKAQSRPSSGSSSQKKTASPLEKSIKKAARSTARSIGRETGKSITRSIMGNKSKTAKAASTMAGSLLADVFGSLFK